MAFLGKDEIYSLLNEKGISYDKMEHEAVYTIDDMDRLGITSRGLVCKNLFLRDAKGKNHFLVSVPENKRVDLKALAAQIGSDRFSFASQQRLSKYLGVEPGCVSPLGILNDESKSVTAVFDQELKSAVAVGVHPNDNTSTIWLAFSDLCKIIEEHGNRIVFAGFESI